MKNMFRHMRGTVALIFICIVSIVALYFSYSTQQKLVALQAALDRLSETVDQLTVSSTEEIVRTKTTLSYLNSRVLRLMNYVVVEDASISPKKVEMYEVFTLKPGQTTFYQHYNWDKESYEDIPISLDELKNLSAQDAFEMTVTFNGNTQRVLWMKTAAFIGNKIMPGSNEVDWLQVYQYKSGTDRTPDVDETLEVLQILMVKEGAVYFRVRQPGGGGIIQTY